MGYFKNQLIAEQVELGDRYFAPPVSAKNHITAAPFVENRQWVRWQREERKQKRKARRLWVFAIVTMVAAGVTLGLLMGALSQVYA